MGRAFPVVEIHLTTSTSRGSVPYYIYELKNAQVVSYSVGGGGSSGSIPMEEITLNFQNLKVKYTEVGSDGSTKGTVEYEYDVETGMGAK